MKREEERLTLVTDFGSLRQGDLVVKFCDAPKCGRKHREMLLSRYTGTAHHSLDGTQYHVVGGWKLHGCLAYPFDSGLTLVTPETVARRIVFLVDVGLTRETDTHEAKPVTKPRELARGTR